jgi:catechol 2,3-dioxygenase-like lactoylglutathione lyase family enzyme
MAGQGMEARMAEVLDRKAGAESDAKSGIVSPSKLAHFVLRTGRYAEILEWYKTVLNAKPAFESDALAFLSYDDEHHRVAILNIPTLTEAPAGIAGVHHVAFTYDSLLVLLENYERLKVLGITPSYVINHGPTTSLYYEDPDHNQLEFQVENFASVEESGKFFFSEAFAENPIGVEFDPDELLRRLRAGEPEEDLKRRPDIGKQSLSDVKLR